MTQLAEGKRHWGIIIALDRPPREIANRLANLLDRLTLDEMIGKLLYA